jgi:hypothetical protein
MVTLMGDATLVQLNTSQWQLVVKNSVVKIEYRNPVKDLLIMGSAVNYEEIR